MSTIRQISEQVSRLYARGIDKENNNTKLNWKEVKPLVSQTINEIMSAQLVSFQGLDVGTSITSGMVMRYTVPVLSRGASPDVEYYSKLPVYPIRLPHNLGLYRVAPKGPFRKAFIIIPECYWDVIESVEDFQGNICVVPAGDNEIIYSADPGISQVYISLVVNDTGNFDDDETLPITADIETEVIKRVLSLFQPEITEPKEVQVKANNNDAQ